jgi:hypothetical protein
MALKYNVTYIPTSTTAKFTSLLCTEVAKVFGTPVVMGAPPPQSVSPLTITNNGLEFGILV